MKLIEIKYIEDCLDQSYIRNFIFEENISDDFIYYLGNTGKLKYYKDFPRPFFQVFSDKFVIKGVLGNTYFQITFFDKNPKAEEELTAFIQKSAI